VSLKVKLALVWFVRLWGLEAITGFGGGIVSITHEKFAGLLWFPPVSCTLTQKVWLPWPKPLYIAGLEQSVNALPSS
jgi:hypothetical protein